MSTFEYEISDGSVIHHTIYYYMDHFDLNMPYLKGGKLGIMMIQDLLLWGMVI